MIHLKPKKLKYHYDSEGIYTCLDNNYSSNGQRLYVKVKRIIPGVYIQIERAFPSWPACFEEV